MKKAYIINNQRELDKIGEMYPDNKENLYAKVYVNGTMKDFPSLFVKIPHRKGFFIGYHDEDYDAALSRHREYLCDIVVW